MAAILNENLEWPDITAAHPEVALAFRGTPVKNLVKPGRMLCRFITTESKKKGIRGNEIFKSPWWMDWGSSVGMLSRWKSRAAPREVIRAKMAVPEAFSQELDSLVQIIFTRPVYAWKGIAQSQNDSARGGLPISEGVSNTTSQIWLPILTVLAAT
jgi:hypothetical protein